MEENPASPYPLLVLTACPVDNRPAGAPRQWGGMKINLKPGTLAYRIYGRPQIEETFSCNYELNPDYQAALEQAGMVVSGVSDQGAVRVVELPGRFYLGLGFIPQLSSGFEQPHPILTAFLKAAVEA